MSAQDNLSKVLFHGTNIALNPGDEVLPPIKTGAEPHSHPDIDPLEFNNASHVYMADTAESAANFAADRGGSHVYEVEPHSDVHEDPESMITGNTGSYRASKAIVKRKIQ